MVWIAVLATSFSLGCQDLMQKIPKGIPSLPGESADQPDLPLEGPVWMLKHIERTDLPASPTQPFAKFEAGVVSGFGGCNQFKGTYTRSGDSIQVKQISATKMFCENNDIEQRFLSNLQRSNKAYLKAGQLLTALNNDALLLFKAKKN